MGAVDDTNLRELLARLDPAARRELRQLLFAKQQRRDAAAERALRQRTSHAENVGDLIDLLTLDNEARRQVVRLLGELETSPQ